LKAGAGRHAAPASRPASLIVLLAGSLVALIGAVGLTASAFAGRAGYNPGPPRRVAVPRGRIGPVPDAADDVAVPKPVFLIIPAIGVRTRLVRLGSTSTGAMAVPTTTSVAGWYTASPRPGAIGSSIIAGHVDSYRGPGIFIRLRDLRPGDRAFVLRTNGTLAVFRITAVRLYLKAKFPFAAVFGPVPYPALRLITCGGSFDPAIGHYLSNVVAFGYEVGSQASLG
jgi:hypothetical protein